MNPFRRPLIAGNWKMNAGGQEACILANTVAERTKTADRVDVVLAPPFTAIAAVAHEIEETRGSIDVDQGFGIGVAAQNIHHLASGAFTGEISAPMLHDAGATWVIIGHSERRQHFHETDHGVALKVKAALDADLRPIACIGETLAERESGETLKVIERQLRAFMNHFTLAPGVGVIAYEPVWAIGTGKVASPEDAQQVHARIREILGEESEELAEATRILYGGSVKADNAAGLLEQADIDGALVGGASLDAEGFSKIVQVAQTVAESIAEDAGGPPSGDRGKTNAIDEDAAADARQGEMPVAAASEENPPPSTTDEVLATTSKSSLSPPDDDDDEVDAREDA